MDPDQRGGAVGAGGEHRNHGTGGAFTPHVVDDHVDFALSRRPCRHGELVDLVGGISRKVLTQTLRRLQGDGLVERRAYAEAPPRVEYSLTELGLTLVEPIAVLTDWAKSYGEAIVSFQEAAEEESASGG
ncbi:helix-turn-helix transcriptional regulator [Microbispora sp. NBC_01189]|nr:helix-turn-helix transcriptional regulator [Microbispora sp. NBC_01189]